MDVTPLALQARVRLCACSKVAALILALLITLSGEVKAQTVFNYIDVWKFNIPTTDPGTAWRNLDFNDTLPLNGVSWGSGRGLMGFETGTLPAPGIQTAVGVTNSAPVVYLFRKTFFFDGNPSNASLAIDQIVDDGVSYYLNGNLIGSVRHTPGFWNNLASGGPGDAVEELNAVTGAAVGLRYGSNVLAAEVHQTGSNGSDMVFGSRLKITASPLASDHWRLLNFGSSANSGNGGDAADPDGDGMSNFVEFALIKDPLRPNSPWGVPSVQGANLALTYSRRKAALTEASFAVVWSATLGGAWSSAGVTEQILSDDGAIQTVLAQVPLSNGNMFMKVQVTRLPIVLPTAAPGSLTAVAVSDTAIDLAWADNSSNETNFKIERRIGTGGVFTQINTVPAGVRNYSDTGLTTGTTYYYQVRANNSAGDSAYTSVVGATTHSLPAAPANLDGEIISGSEIKLTWSDNSNNETGFKLERRQSGSGLDYAPLATVGVNVLTFRDTTVVAGNAYYYRVRAYNGVGLSDYSQKWVTIGVPSAPTAISAIVGSASRIDITWVADQVNNESGFRIERRISGDSASTFTQVGTAGMNATAFSDSSVTAGVRYVYRVLGYNVLGSSAIPNPAVEARETAGVPAAPTGLMLVAATSTRVDLAWEDNADNETQYKIERRVSGGSFAQITTLAANAVAYQDNTATPGITYIYRVCAANAAGNSAYSGEPRITAGPPLAPTGFTATPVSHSQINLAWTDASNSETSYSIERRSGASSFAVLAVMPSDTTVYQDANLSPATAYIYRVRASNAAGNSAYSSEVSVSTPAAPAAPTGATVRRAHGTYQAPESIAITFIAQPDGSVKIRDTVATVVPAGYKKYYIINEETYEGELENAGTFQPYTNITIVKVIARGPAFYNWDDSPTGNDYLLPQLGGAAEIYTGTR